MDQHRAPRGRGRGRGRGFGREPPDSGSQGGRYASGGRGDASRGRSSSGSHGGYRGREPRRPIGGLTPEFRLKASCETDSRSLASHSPGQEQLIDAALALADQNEGLVVKSLGSPEHSGLLRIREICASEVSERAGPDPELTSLQRVIAPLLALLSHPRVANNTLTQFVKPMQSTVWDQLDWARVAGCLRALEALGSCRDPAELPRQQSAFWRAGSWTELLHPLVHFLSIGLPAFGGLGPEGERRTALEDLLALLPALHAKFPDGDLRQRQSLAKQLQHLRSFLGRERRAQESAATMARLRGEREAKRQEAERLFGPQTDGDGQPLVGPGHLRPEGPRHDNDHADIRDVRLAPTQAEVLCEVGPYLPRNRPGAYTHLQRGSEEALLDTQFRLLRHDLLAPIKSSASAFKKAGGLEWAKQNAGARFTGPMKRQQRQEGAAGGNPADADVSLDTYCDVHFHGLEEHFSCGLTSQISFEEPVAARAIVGKKHKEEWWERSSRLSRGTIIALWWEEGGEPRLLFATVEDRRAEQLAGPRPRIGIRVCSGSDADTAALFSASVAECLPDNSPCALLQSSGNSYFAYRPVLQALQALRLPYALAGLLVHTEAVAERPPVHAIEPPQYVADSPDLHYNFQSLVAADRWDTLPQATREQLLAVDVANQETFPHAALAAATTLDEAQRRALQAALSQKLALIQGPPGTGKTYVGILLVRLLLANLDKETGAPLAAPHVGPILCVCYTNHALDQFLEGLLDAGVDASRIVRMGGKSKTERLAPRNLRELRKGAGQHVHRKLVWEGIDGLKDLAEEFKGLQSSLQSVRHKQVPEKTGMDYLGLKAPLLHRSLEKQEGERRQARARQARKERAGGTWHTKGKRNKDRDKGQQRSVWDEWVAGPRNPEPVTQQRGERAQGKARREAKVREWEQRSEAHQKLLEGQKWLMDITAAAHELGVTTEWLVSKEGQSKKYQQLLRMAKAMRGGGPQGDGNPSRALTAEATEEAAEHEDPLFNLADDPASDRPLAQLLQQTNAWSLSMRERQTLLTHMLEDVRDSDEKSLMKLVDQHNEMSEDLLNARNSISLEVLRDAAVIGATTTGLANVQQLAKSLGAKIVIVEEAAEVLEAHILTSLTEETQQLILIGDHEQLPPKVDVYELTGASGQGFNLDVSLFERLVRTNAVAPVTLREQRRMRPCIAELIRRTVYPSLQDHASVRAYPPLPGLQHSLFWWDHEEPEGGAADGESRSKNNEHEAACAARLALYMRQQGKRVAILTPYLGQLMLLRQHVSRHTLVTVEESDQDLVTAQDEAQAEDQQRRAAAGEAGMGSANGFIQEPAGWEEPGHPVLQNASLRESVRLATIDNFQGEEEDFIILSLVRKNRDGNIGFVKSKQRSNVLLSRAREGMVIIGNAASFREARHGIWAQVVGLLDEQGLVGQELGLVCQRHPEPVTLVKDAAGFDAYAREGGCSRQCDLRLPCGHACPKLCHSHDLGHEHVLCERPCPRLHEGCGHACRRMCSEPCGLCMQPILHAVALPCGHTKAGLPCHRAQQPEKEQCMDKVLVQMPHCGHQHWVNCYDADRFKGDPTSCRSPCKGTLPCGHPCTAQCGQCLKLTLQQQGVAQGGGGKERPATLPALRLHSHGLCQRRCERTLMCGHECGAPCHAGQPCPPCTKPCLERCPHSRCQRTCAEPCARCAEPCQWYCPHQGACSQPCGAPCDRLPCNERCELRLACGHRCPSVCGETCPPASFCTVCGSAQWPVHDLLMAEEWPLRYLTEAALAADPIIVLPCKHAFTMTSLDSHTELGDFYEFEDSPEGQRYWIGPSKLQGDKELMQQKACPICKGSLAGLFRYGRSLRKRAIDIASFRFTLFTDELVRSVQAALAEAESRTVELLKQEGVQEQQCNQVEDQLWQAYNDAFKAGCDVTHPPSRRIWEAASAQLTRTAEEQGWLPRELEDAQGYLLMAKPEAGPFAICLLAQARCMCLLADVEAKAALALADAAIKAGPAWPCDHPHQPHLEAMAYEKWMASTKHAHVADTLINDCLGFAQRHSLKLTEGETYCMRAGILHAAALRLQAFRRGPLKLLATPARCGGEAAFLHNTHQDQLATLDAARIASRRAYTIALDLLSKRAQAGGTAPPTRLTALKKKAAALANENTEVCMWVEEAERDEETSMVVKALLAADATLDNQGYGYGHFYRCLNGHPFVVGDRDGVQQAAKCIECGARVGGTGYRLADGNTADEDLINIARA